MKLRNLQALVESLESAVRSLKPPDPRSDWSGYYEMDSYSPVGLQSKRSIVARCLERTAPATVWDLGSNTGMFSRLASARGAATLSIDSDHDAVEANYREVRRQGESNILPLWIDLVNPSGGIGWNNRERVPLADRGRPEMVFALALLHHLAISQNVPFGMIAEFLAGITRRWLALEFIPKSDPKTRLLLSSRVDIFSSYTREEFERAFQRRFSIEAVDPVEDSQRVLYLMQART
jgi:ribosomal protein L11 methylase PrmA